MALHHILRHILGMLVAGNLAVVGVSGASASLISHGSSFGADTITLDTNTGLEWLDLPITQGLSINQVTAQLGAGGQFAGFQYAYASDLATLILDAGITNGNSTDSANIAAVSNLISLLGQTFTITVDGRTSTGTRGFTRDHGFHGPNDNESGLIFIAQNSDGSTQEIANPFGFDDFIGFDSIDSGGGNFLVRSVVTDVPEPSTWAMLLMGFAGIGFASFKRKTALTA